MKCPYCGTLIEPGFEFCPGCGSRVESRPKKRRWPSILLSVLLSGLFLTGAAMAWLPFLALAEPQESTPTTKPSGDSVTVCGDYFLLEDGVLTFLPENYEGGAVLYVPDEINGEPVTAIGTGCFADCTDLTTIWLPNSIQTIYPNAFSGCTKLRGMDLPEGVTQIGEDAFSGCISMEAIYIPGDISSIASGAFDGCAALHYIFYNGTFEQWDAIYPDYITPFTYAICTDGDYYHGAA